MAKKSRESAGSEAEQRERLELEVRIDTDLSNVAEKRRELDRKITLAGGSPLEVQIAFIKGLVEDAEEAQKFMKDPKGYSVEHGVLMELDMVRDVTNSMLFDANVSREFLDKLGSRGARDLLDLRANHTVAAIPVAVVAAAAAVVAVAAVVEAVVTVVRTKAAADFRALKGLGPQGVILPGGKPFRFE